MRKLAAAFIVAGISLFAVTPALAAPHNPHQEEQDGCDHGHTGKPCRPDPQPNHGKDCVKHGKHGGINEDHCASTTTTTQPEVTTTTQPEVTTTTQPEVTTTTQPEATTTTEAPVVTTTTEAPVVTTTTVPEVTTTTQAPGTTVTSAPAATTLARTGSYSSMMAMFGAAAAMLGIGLMLMGKSLKRAEAK
jgi:hypothetical protein